MSEWGRRTVIGVREYYYNGRGAPGVGYAANVPYLSASVPKFHSFGARYMTAETSDSWAAGLIGLNVAAELMWNVKADPEAVKTDVIGSAFPSAKAEMRGFFDLIDGECRVSFSEDLLARMYAALSAAWKRASSEGERILPARSGAGNGRGATRRTRVERRPALFPDVAKLPELPSGRPV